MENKSGTMPKSFIFGNVLTPCLFYLSFSNFGCSGRKHCSIRQKCASVTWSTQNEEFLNFFFLFIFEKKNIQRKTFFFLLLIFFFDYILLIMDHGMSLIHNIVIIMTLMFIMKYVRALQLFNFLTVPRLYWQS